MSQQFNSIKVSNTARSTFDLSHHQVTTSDFGYLIPVCMRNMIPNDDFVVKPDIFCRMAPSAYPFYGKVLCRLHSFFVPYRILFPHWNAFITQAKGNTHIPPSISVADLSEIISLDPQFGQDNRDQPRGLFGRIMANFGIDPTIFSSSQNAFNNNGRISAFPFLAYYRIWLDWFMDSNIYDHSQMVAAFNSEIQNGGILDSVFVGDIMRFRNACFGKDYFTTAKLHPQAGSDPSLVGVDIAGSSLNPGLNSVSGTANVVYNSGSGNVSVTGATGSNTPKIGQFTVEDLRAAVSLQRYLERNNYVGTKVINQMLVHYGIAPTPERLDMSEFLGGSNIPLQVGDVTSHSTVSSQDPTTIGLGAQAGKGIIRGQSETIRYHAKEHGIFMTLMSIIPDTGYYQGVSKHWFLGVNGDPLDYYTPEFENLGFQEILNKEVYVPDPHQLDTAYQSYDPDAVWGYAPRYGFMKFQHDILAGDFVGHFAAGSGPVLGTNMDAWHLFRKLVYDDDNPLELNANFMECDNHENDFDRVFQVTDNNLDHFYFSIDVDVKATRDMVGFAEPSLEETNMGDGNKVNIPYGGTRL